MAATRITIKENGGIIVEGDFEIVDQGGKAFGLGGRTKVTLCRCGHSAGKPFCDASHRHHGFISAVEARDLPPRKANG